MTVLIDPPFWPAHGTVFSHLISDSSLDELHAFAEAAGIPERAFDGDHYDVAERHFERLVTLGAVSVSGKELARRLAASGLRIPARERPSKLLPALRHRWETLLPGWPSLGEELLERWGEPHRHYHSRVHLLNVLEALELLLPESGLAEDARRPLLLAAWFHDAVYQGVPGRDEEDSALLAEHSLHFLPGSERAEVARLVRLTTDHAPGPEDLPGHLLCDADLSVLAWPQPRYARYLAAVRADYAHVPDADFARGRAAVVGQLLALDPLFHSATARRLWLQDAQRNLRSELAAAPEESA
ncbi:MULTISPECIES: DUF4031 domain-containing protein [Arthrobacter]|uniref:DUF4031 domain-containing protein n=2 Tax=Arthrobacter TaxID=1663 RepID=A0ABU9KLX4_9MICC|nr:DUF4031 domain-containing protein [Arthrobacter sp. YJM1]MDP5228167.1 DUF4031 domain-containing protein [Arthrobacter sp. YJM1]